MASAGPAAADRIDSLPAGVLRLADRLPPSKRGKPASPGEALRGQCLLHDAATAASASITQHVARAGSSMRRWVQVMAVPLGSQEQRPPERPAEDAVSLSISRPRRCSGGGCGADRLQYSTASSQLTCPVAALRTGRKTGVVRRELASLG